ncbi:hypothetical protein PTTW11_09084 [Pyrenophora teres f. teres]|uniref:Uncharacterized protein n=1 Tax=Pyrenophora teres f. teres TaxID=97479 RepID=A0A6S6WGD5_9PLEO|nr:hypothetical protein PTTW11_09084 [Pyrenophora teres f. teres]
MKVDEAMPPGPFDPCYACQMAYDVCVKKCGLGPGCPAMCKCQATGPNPLCNRCPTLQCTSFVRKVRRGEKIIGDA